MTMLRFFWDPTKAQANHQKHGVSFEEAQTVFFDDDALLLDDPDHSWEERRCLLLGLSAAFRILLVCHTVSGDELIRIISAREASRSELKQYRERLKE